MAGDRPENSGERGVAVDSYHDAWEGYMTAPSGHRRRRRRNIGKKRHAPPAATRN